MAQALPVDAIYFLWSYQLIAGLILFMAMSRKVSHERWKFAQLHQQIYQQKKSKAFAGYEKLINDHARLSSARVVNLLEELDLSPATGLVVEVGSGAHGLIWEWPAKQRIAIDPLADYYHETFSSLQTKGPAILAAQGEKLPLSSGIADLVLSDNVLDHVEAPLDYLRECRRILKPGGILFFSVDVHHPAWHWGAGAYNGLFRLGLRSSLPAFPNHPFHFSNTRAGELLRESGFHELRRWGGLPPTQQQGLVSRLRTSIRTLRRDHDVQAAVKQIFLKNVRLEIVANSES